MDVLVPKEHLSVKTTNYLDFLLDIVYIMGKTRGRHTKRKVGGRRTRRGGYWFYPSDNDNESSWGSLNPFKKKEEGAAAVVPASSESEPAPEPAPEPEPAAEESSAPAPGGPAEGPSEPSVQEEPSMAGGRRRRRRKSRKASRRKSKKGKKARKSRKSKRRSRKRAYKKRK